MGVRTLLERIQRGFRSEKSLRNRRKRSETATGSASETLESRQLLTIDFTFVYPAPVGGGSQIGFEDPVLGQIRRNVLQAAAADYGALFANDANIVLEITSSDDPNSGGLASAGSQYVINGAASTFGGIEVVRNKVVNGVDLNGSLPDGRVDVNWGHNWEISSDPTDVDATEFDFYFVIFHELTHAMGFASAISQDGSSFFGTQPGTAGVWNEYDRFLVNAAGNPVVDSTGVLDLPLWNVDSVGGDSQQSLGLFFDGPVTRTVNAGQPAGLYTPITWQGGSSVSHLDSNNPAYSGMIMRHVVSPGPRIHSFSAIEKAILVDLGYTPAGTISITESGNNTQVSDLGTSDRITVTIGRQPASDVVLNLSSGDTGEVTLSTNTLTFTPSNWNIPQTVLLNGVGDGLLDGNQTTNITISVDDAASDPTFAPTPDVILPVTSVDDDGLVPAKPVLIGPPQLAPSNTPLIEWTSGANSFSFTLTVTNLVTGQVVDTAIGLRNNSHVFANPLPDGIYQAEVRAFNALGQGGPVSDPLIFGVGDPIIPTAPSVLAPGSNQQITTSRPVIEWTSVPGAFTYEIYINTSGRVIQVTDPGVTTANGTLSYTLLENLDEGTNTVWVRGINAFDQPGAWSEGIRFTVDAFPAPAQPIMTKPSVATTSNAFPQFAWTTGGAVRWQLWVSGLRAGTGVNGVPAIYDRMIHLTDYAGTSYTHFNALPEGPYRAWVRGINAAGEFSAWSEVNQFTIALDAPETPALLPIGTTTDRTPTFRWEGSGQTFDLWVNNISTGENQVIRQQTLTGNSYTPTVPLSQGRHRAWIQASNAVGEKSAWSTAIVFDVDVPAPSRPVVTGPAADATLGVVTEPLPTFTWDSATNAVSYELWVNHNESRTAKIVYQSGLTETSFTPDTPLPQGNYRAWVRATNDAGEVGDWSLVYTFNLDVPTPVAPVITSPKANAVGSVDDATPTFAWTTLDPADTYDLQVEVVSSGALVVDVTGITGQSYTVTKTLSEQAYRARVRGVNATDTADGEPGAWSDWFSFVIDEPNATTPIAYLPTGTVTSNTVTFQWQHTAGNTKYELLVRDLLRQETVTIQVNNIELDLLGNRAISTQTLANGTYRFWVRAFNSQGTASSWSNSQAFNIVAQAEPTSEGNDLSPDIGVALVSLQRSDLISSDVADQTAPEVPINEAADGSPDSVIVVHTERRAVMATSKEASSQDTQLIEAIEQVMATMADPTLAAGLLDDVT